MKKKIRTARERRIQHRQKLQSTSVTTHAKETKELSEEVLEARKRTLQRRNFEKLYNTDIDVTDPDNQTRMVYIKGLLLDYSIIEEEAVEVTNIDEEDTRKSMKKKQFFRELPLAEQEARLKSYCEAAPTGETKGEWLEIKREELSEVQLSPIEAKKLSKEELKQFNIVIKQERRGRGKGLLYGQYLLVVVILVFPLLLLAVIKHFQGRGIRQRAVY